ncbi:hypothetical protein NBRC116188_00790 [Oceaniserpentilla sp. 4NH20-0058]|uniref:DUF6435 family protein n=1 Tax=Oceaniserpentilla sp. 4NH20-0058 TaxID=3127660 RepID=UPI003108F442
MFSIFKNDPVKKLREEYEGILTKAMHAQRNGNIKEYSYLSAQADRVLERLQAEEASNNQ